MNFSSRNSSPARESRSRSASPPDDAPAGLIAGTSVGTGEVTQRRRRCQSRSPSKLAQKHIPLKLSLTLENTGSVARDHLALERTYLAYVRTSLGIVSAGVALVQLFAMAGATNPQLKQYSKPLGSVFIVFGMLTLALGAVRYFVVQRALIKGIYPAVRVSVMLLSIALGVIIVVVFGIILALK